MKRDSSWMSRLGRKIWLVCYSQTVVVDIITSLRNVFLSDEHPTSVVLSHKPTDPKTSEPTVLFLRDRRCRSDQLRAESNGFFLGLVGWF
jgi:hypothetical protein